MLTGARATLEAWAYERVVAPAILALGPALTADFVAALPPCAHLLDVGCGGGGLARALAEQRGDLRVTGVDLAAAQVARARRAARGLGERVRFVEGSVLALPFEAGGFDGVLSVASLKLWPDRARGLAECARVLRPGGALRVIELDRGAGDDDVRRFVDAWRAPAPLRALFQHTFRAMLATQALDLADVRALTVGLPIVDAGVERVPDTPFLSLNAGR
jgi:ubiquinone/menaquinone biosynthesis C-methylase UbiE